jgi:lactonase family protein with 7-bladed beta-propeller
MTGDARWTRRDFLSATALGMIGIGSRNRSLGADERFAYIGTYTNAGRSEGIYRLFLHATTGAMRVDGVAAKSADPSFLALHPNGRVLYAVNELEQFGGKRTAGAAAVARHVTVLRVGRQDRPHRAGGELRDGQRCDVHRQAEWKPRACPNDRPARRARA